MDTGGEAARAMRAIAEYAKNNSSLLLRSGPVASASEMLDRRTEIKDVVNELESMADRADKCSYQDFEVLLHRFHAVSFWPPNEMVSDVARALTLVKKTGHLGPDE
jgi:hypothetical protein